MPIFNSKLDEVAEWRPNDKGVIEIDNWVWDNEALLILLNPKGCLYSAQAGGMLCDHPEARGFLVPVIGSAVSQKLKTIHDNICGIHPTCSSPADEDDADLIDSVLGYAFRVDRSRLDQLMEAWIPVITASAGPSILVYSNCD